MVESRLLLANRQYGLHFVRANHEPRCVQVVVTADDVVAEEFGQFVRLQFLHRWKASLLAFFPLRTHGESTQLYRMTRVSSSISSASDCTNSSGSKSPNRSISYGLTTMGLVSPWAIRSCRWAIP
jgi:hypothetical protein